MKFQFIALSLFLFYPLIHAQQVFNWQNYTDMKKVSSVQAAGNGVWAASSGGAFFYNTDTKDFKTLHKSDGLFGMDLNAVTFGPAGTVWFGSADGSIDVYNLSSNTIKTILDIFSSNYTTKGINDLSSNGDTIFVSSDFGLSLIDAANNVFFDTFFKFGNLQPYTKVNSALKNGLFYLATDGGAAIQKPGAVNLSAPESWNSYTTSDGLPSNTVIKIVKINNQVIAATDKGMSIFNDTTWTDFLPQFDNQGINDLFLKNDSLFITSGKNLYIYDDGTVTQIYTADRNLNKISYSNSLGLIASTNNGIIVIKDGSYIYPNGPAANQFPELHVDSYGNLWSASGKDGTGVGFYKFNGSTWSTYNKSNTPQIVSNDYYFVNTGPRGEVYVGNWGAGFTVLKNNDTQIETFKHSNSPLVGISQDSNFVVISGFGNDSRGNLWILNYWAGDARTLSMLTPDSTWHLFSNPFDNQSLEFHYDLAIDPYDTKWYSIRNSSRLGLLYFNENGTYTDSSDDKFGFLTTDDGLNSNTIYSVVSDQRGDIWVGTNLGVNIITNNFTILSGQRDLFISSVFTLRQQTINVIAVDALNNKWVGTNQGLLEVNSDGSSLLAIYNSQNSPLPSDEIRSVAIDENKGRVYVGTDAGLTSFDTPDVKPVDSFSKLFIYPNPFIVNDGNKQMTIDGLIKDSEIKILSIEGKLIRDFVTPGGRVAYWDGRNADGSYVASGVYLVVAFDSEGNNVTTAKVAVLHK